MSGSRWFLRELLCGAGIFFGVNAATATLTATSTTSTTATTVPAPSADASERDLIARGEYLAKAADCGACHTVPRNKPFTGGLAINSPVGLIYSTNITPSLNFGIGRYTLTQFTRALRRGIRDDGANLYPAMPYTSYSLLTDEDVGALYAYFMKSVVAVDVRGEQTKLPFPLNIRLSMRAWNILFLNDAPYTADLTHDREWNRGRYLVRALAHCGECHTPRGLLMQTKSALELAGARVGPWYAPNITADVASGLGSWSKDELARYLRTGVLVGKARAAGSMAEAVEDSFQYLTAADLAAMSAYVSTVPAIHEASDESSRFGRGKASSELGTFRGIGGIRSDGGTPVGAEIYLANCGSCHAALGQGTKDGYYPSLFDNSTVGARNPNNLIATILHGVNRTTSAGQAYMPGFGGRPRDMAALSDEEIALVCNYLIDHFGRGTGHVTAKDVADVRTGGPPSALPTLVRAGVALAAAGAIVILILCLVVRRRFSRNAERLR